MRSNAAQQLICELETENFDSFTDTALGEDLIDLRKTIDRLEFQCARRLDLFARRRGYEAFGFVTLISWLRRACRLLPGAALQRAEVARNLPSLPGTAAAVASGDIGFHHAAVIAHSVTEVGVEAVARQESVLLEAAQNCDPKRLSYATRTIRLDAEGGAIVRAAIGACEHPFQPNDQTTGGQRRADALVELCRQRLDSGTLPEVGGQKPHLTVTASIETLTKKPGAPAGELEWGPPINAEMVRRIACDCAMTRVLLDGRSEAIDVGRCTRTFPPAMLRALAARDKHCRFPGCDRPPTWCDGHHLIHWLDGGETKVSNGCLLCRRHHRFVHELGWQLRRGAPGEIIAIKRWWMRADSGHVAGVAPPLA